MSEEEKKDYFEISFVLFLGIQLILIALKLLEVIRCSWWIILLPIEIYFAIGVLSAVVIVFYIVFVEKH